jgi:hypothetical protein
MVLQIRSLFSIARFDFLPSSQFNCLMVMLTCLRFLAICCFHVNFLSIVIPRYLISVFRGILINICTRFMTNYFFLHTPYVFLDTYAKEKLCSRIFHVFYIPTICLRDRLPSYSPIYPFVYLSIHPSHLPVYLHSSLFLFCFLVFDLHTTPTHTRIYLSICLSKCYQFGCL